MLDEQKEKKCQYCKEVIKIDAIVCRHCNRDLVQPRIIAPPKKEPLIAGILNMIIPGAGTAYAGYWGRGFLDFLIFGSLLWVLIPLAFNGGCFALAPLVVWVGLFLEGRSVAIKFNSQRGAK